MSKHRLLSACRLAVSSFGGLLWSLTLTGASRTWAAAPVLLCEVRYASDTRQLHQAVSSDPYTGQSVDFEGRFRFKAVVLGTPDRIEHITLTVYELGLGDAPVIIHQARYQAPFQTMNALPALTGWNLVYASSLGRELRYGCALQAEVPAASKALSP